MTSLLQSARAKTLQCHRSNRRHSRLLLLPPFLPVVAFLLFASVVQSARFANTSPPEVTLANVSSISPPRGGAASAIASGFSAAATRPRRRSLLFNRLIGRWLGRWYCDASKLSGYTSSVYLGDGMTFHWVATIGSQVDVALEVKGGSKSAGGWFAVGWSPDGNMAGSMAIAKESNIVPTMYNVLSRDVQPATDWTVYYAVVSATTGGGFVMKFTREKGDNGPVPLVTTKLVDMIFAYGYQSYVQSHTWKATALVNFSCGCGLFRRKC